MDQQELDRVEKLCREAIAAAEAMGCLVRPGGSPRRSVRGCCCILGAVRGQPSDDLGYDSDAARNMGLTLSQAESVEFGFEGWPAKSAHDPALHAIGQKLRAEQLGKVSQ